MNNVTHGINEVGAMLGISADRVLALMACSGLPFVSISFDRVSVLEWIRKRTSPQLLLTEPFDPNWPKGESIDPLEPPTSGGVYAVGSVSGPIKIGRAWNIRNRVMSLQTSSPQRLALIAVLSNLEDDERKFHQLLADHRLHGEWFAPHPSVLEVVRAARFGK